MAQPVPMTFGKHSRARAHASVIASIRHGPLEVIPYVVAGRAIYAVRLVDEVLGIEA